MCAETPEGDICVAACAEDGDCPTAPDGATLVCDTEAGACVPEDALPTGCESDDDCEDGETCDVETGACGAVDPGPECEEDCSIACPDEPLGCACGETPEGPACVPACETDEDCPAAPDGASLVCDVAAGVCTPDQGGETGCADELDCVGQCAEEALGCACDVAPDGVGQCLPTCTTDDDCVGLGDGLVCVEDTGLCGSGDEPEGCESDDDCPAGPDGEEQVCGDDGECVAADTGPVEPTSCTVEADCVDQCPAGSLGCTCEATPDGDLCVPTCEVDDDCPAGEGLVCLQAKGICVPEGGPPGG